MRFGVSGEVHIMPVLDYNFNTRRWAAYGAALSIAGRMRMTFTGPSQVNFDGAATPPCWRISYFAQSRYRGGTIRVTVDHETAEVLATEIQFDSGGLSGPLDLPPFELPPAFGGSGKL